MEPAGKRDQRYPIRAWPFGNDFMDLTNISAWFLRPPLGREGWGAGWPWCFDAEPNTLSTTFKTIFGTNRCQKRRLRNSLQQWIISQNEWEAECELGQSGLSHEATLSCSSSWIAVFIPPTMWAWLRSPTTCTRRGMCIKICSSCSSCFHKICMQLLAQSQTHGNTNTIRVH